MAVFVSVFTIVFVSKAYGYREPTYRTIVIRNGDTLWNIAEKYNIKGDIRHYIYNIKKLNNLSDSEVIEGMELKVIVN